MDARTAESALTEEQGGNWIERARSSGRLYDYATVAAGLLLVATALASIMILRQGTAPGALLSPPLGPAAAPLFRLTRLITVGLLPARVRDQYGFPWNAQRERSYRRAVALIRRTRRLLPAVFREWPAARLAA